MGMMILWTRSEFMGGGNDRRDLTGVFAVSVVNPIFKDSNGNVLALGLIEGNAHQLVNQLVGVAIAWALGIVGLLRSFSWSISSLASVFRRSKKLRGSTSRSTEKKDTTGRLPCSYWFFVLGRAILAGAILGKRTEKPACPHGPHSAVNCGSSTRLNPRGSSTIFPLQVTA